MDKTFPIKDDYIDPFNHPALKEAGVFELIKDLISPKARPFDCLQVEVSSYCTAKCTYCPHTTKASTWNSLHMKPHTFVNLWPILQQTTRIHLQGWGEPLLHPHFFDFVALARKAGCQVSTTSCGLHLNQDIAEKIINSGMDIIAFSFAGTDQASNSSRKNADFDKVCKGIKLLQVLRKEKMAVHLQVHLAYLLLADQLEAVKKLPLLMQDLGAHAAVVSTLDYIADEKQSTLAINPQNSEIISKAQEILQKASAEAKKHEQEIFYALPSLQKSPICRENIQKSLYIDAEGNIAPCIYLNVPFEDADIKQIVFGNINKENILNIWKKNSFQEFRLAHEKNKVIAQCKNCVKKHEVLH